jgi:hypothetical protein
MEPLTPLTPLAEIAKEDPDGYGVIQELIRSTIRSSPEVVTYLARYGVAGESLHEAIEGLLEKGLLRYRVATDPVTERISFYLQVYDIRDLTYRDVGTNPWS